MNCEESCKMTVKNRIEIRNMSSRHAAEIQAGNRFRFGENWSRFLTELNESRILQAERSLCEMLDVTTLQGKRFLDIGSGSGLLSLAARRLGATVHSFDFDPQSVDCTTELKQRYFPNDNGWTIEQGSVLDKPYLETLGQWNIVYSWGVLHHTGNLLQALDHASDLVKDGGNLFIAIYNDQGRTSRVWLKVKRAYNRLPRGLRWLILWPAAIRLWGPTTLRDLAMGRPFHTWRNYSQGSMRGMSAWRDVVDWVGGLPFEVATPEKIFNFYRDRGFQLQQLKTCAGGHGCNEFVFRKSRPTDVTQ
ncbi:MAG: Methyltransferase type 12 [Planctomycetaceae bacterium]|nr:Methyltransferase type 12 [Planctomycetaceae bacterium]